ncbi:GNAT family N-acetyltransferase [Psychromonas hadalis]|uniref:GNAT family N-acetyltransferase n=1 Tax=Psychromonas hadalis TaxID=211669 RepID=UPI0003B5FA5A|nr:GNAT family N-acetyltransferase [Psychromonas hadalis]
MHWVCLKFCELSNMQLYQLLKLRVDVFVVEQNCPYPELDDKDHQEDVYHLLGYQADKLVACARLLAPGISYAQVSLGRIAIAKTHRQYGLGKLLLSTALQQCEQYWPQQDIQIGAQVYLINFYTHFGFKRHSADYLEDDIEHLDMLLSK